MKLVGVAVLVLSAATLGAVRNAEAGAPAGAGAGSFTAGTVQEAKAGARATAETWLEVADADKYDRTWDELATFVKAQLTREQWRLTMELLRSGAGHPLSRKFEKSLYTETLPGVPDGSYVVVAYQTVFEKQAATTELVTVALDGDGSWRVAGYHVRWNKEP